MATLVWDELGSRTYESGVDRGVVYFPDGSAIPWSGLTEVIDGSSKTASPIYYDGMKIRDEIEISESTAKLKSITYPEELEDFEGNKSIQDGVRIDNQLPQIMFALCYRTKVGNDLLEDSHYKIHVIYNITLTRANKTYSTNSDSPEIVEFEWLLNTVQQEVPGFHPTSHIIIDTSTIDPALLIEVEQILFGWGGGDAELPPMDEFLIWLRDWEP